MELRLIAQTGGLCPACYTRQRTVTCVRCGRLRPANLRLPEGPLCLRCYRHEPDTQTECIRCGRRSWSDARTPEGPLCSSCRPRRKEPCHLCGQMRAFRTVLMGGPACRPCFLQLRRTPGPCPLCSKTKVLAFHAQRAPGQRVCAACASEPSLFACQQCASEAHHYGSRCAVCVLAERATALLSGPNGHVVDQLQPALQALLAVERPKSTLFWLQTSDAAGILRDMAQGPSPTKGWTPCPAPSAWTTCATSSSSPECCPNARSISIASARGWSGFSPTGPSTRPGSCAPTPSGRCCAASAPGPRTPRSPSARPSGPAPACAALPIC